MTDTTQAAPAATPKATGLISRVFAKGFAALSVAERKEVLADATITAGITDAIGKAHEAMAGEVEQIEDLWDGGPAQPAPTKRARENMAGDSIPTGSGQSASGGGAEKMVREYSDVAPQNAVMTATERLGNAITLKAMRELAKAVEGINTRLDLLTTATGGVFDELAAVKAEVAKAARAAVVKSEDEEADEEARDEEDKEMSAKSRVKLAKARVAKAVEADLDGDAKAASRHRAVARAHLAKARAFAQAAAKAAPEADLSAVTKAIGTVAKAIKSEADTTEETADSDDKDTAKSATAAQASAVDPAALMAALKSAQEAVEKANAGYALIRTDVQGLMNTVAGQSRSATTPADILQVAKSNPADLDGKIAQVRKMAEDGLIDESVADTATDLFGTMKAIVKGAPLDPAIVKARAARLPAAVQQLFGLAA